MAVEFPFGDAKHAVERHLQGSGMACTVLRPTAFVEAWLGPALGFDYANARAQKCGAGESPISWISLRNVAQFAVASLDNPAARNAVLELGGPDALSPPDVVAIFEEVGGRPFEVSHVPQKALWAQYEAAEDPLQKTFACVTCSCSVGDTIGIEETVKAFLVQPTSVKEYAEAVMGGA
jgi:uncharacterized protein YbjT (DUF2867 family)